MAQDSSDAFDSVLFQKIKIREGCAVKQKVLRFRCLAALPFLVADRLISNRTVPSITLMQGLS